MSAYHSNDDAPPIGNERRHAKASLNAGIAPRAEGRAASSKSRRAAPQSPGSSASFSAGNQTSSSPREERTHATAQSAAPGPGDSPSPTPPGTTDPSDQNDQHIDALLSELAERRIPPTENEIEALASRMASHLITCEDCQHTLSVIIHRLTEQAGENSAERERGTRLLEHFNSVLVKTRARKRLGAYALMCCTKGEAAAAQEFPDVAAHLATCERCREDVAIRRQQLEERIKAQEDSIGPR